MVDKKKLHFLELAFLFGLVAVLTLLYQWGYSPILETGTGMMSGSMGSMMVSMHGRGATLAELLRQEEASEAGMTGSSSHQGHHGNHLSRIHYITTMTIIVLLPLIIAGSAFLAVIWVK